MYAALAQTTSAGGQSVQIGRHRLERLDLACVGDPLLRRRSAVRLSIDLVDLGKAVGGEQGSTARPKVKKSSSGRGMANGRYGAGSGTA